MNRHFNVKLLWAIMGIGFATISLSACAMSDTSRAAFDLKRLKPERYFTGGLQADFVAAVGRGDLQRADKLLAEGANVDAVGKDGMTPLFWAIGQQNIEGFRFLLNRGADPNLIARWRDAKGQAQFETALRLAAMLDSERYLRALLDCGGNPNLVIDSAGRTPIYTAILHQRHANVELLLQKGAGINYLDNARKTPINHAISMNHYSLALLLLRRGADPKIKNRWGYSAVDTTKQFGNRGVVIGSEDEAAYAEFVTELKRLGLW